MIASQWESAFARWSSSPSQSERDRSDNAINAVRRAIQASADLQRRSIKVFVQGSYRNRVNVRSDSDVDIGVVCNDIYLYDYPAGVTSESLGHTAGSYPFSAFKSQLGSALVAHFGAGAVLRGNKAFSVNENTYRVNADVVPLFEYRQYWDKNRYRAGVALLPDAGDRIENFPERLFESWPSTPLHYENGLAKNEATSRAYRGVVRIVKCLLNTMQSDGVRSASPIPGYLCECLVYNCPNQLFQGATWVGRVDNVLRYLWYATNPSQDCSTWTEVDEVKILFHSSQKWTRSQAFSFLSDLVNKLS